MVHPWTNPPRPGLVLALIWALSAVSLAGCSGCDGCSAAGRHRVEGEHPYVRCTGVEPPDDAEWSVGELSLQRRGRHLTVSGVEGTLRMAALVGPGLDDAPPSALTERIDAAGTALTWVLGELGDDVTSATATLGALAAHEGLTFVLASGRDDMNVLEEVWGALDDEDRAHVVDLRSVDSVQVGEEVFAIVQGAPEGRYARDQNACGFAADELDDLFDDLPDARRWLVSWAAPAGGVAAGEAGDGGSRALQQAMGEAEIGGGVFGWPANQGMRAFAEGRELAEREAHPAFQLVVPRAVGLPQLRADGSAVPLGVAVVELRAGGMALLTPP